VRDAQNGKITLTFFPFSFPIAVLSPQLNEIKLTSFVFLLDLFLDLFESKWLYEYKIR